MPDGCTFSYHSTGEFRLRREETADLGHLSPAVGAELRGEFECRGFDRSKLKGETVEIAVTDTVRVVPERGFMLRGLTGDSVVFEMRRPPTWKNFADGGQSPPLVDTPTVSVDLRRETRAVFRFSNVRKIALTIANESPGVAYEVLLLERGGSGRASTRTSKLKRAGPKSLTMYAPPGEYMAFVRSCHGAPHAGVKMIEKEDGENIVVPVEARVIHGKVIGKLPRVIPFGIEGFPVAAGGAHHQVYAVPVAEDGSFIFKNHPMGFSTLIDLETMKRFVIDDSNQLEIER